MRRPLRRFSTTAVFAIAVIPWSMSLNAQAGCLPLPAPELHDLDVETPKQPASALKTAETRLHDRKHRDDPLMTAQLYAIVAEANADIDKPDLALQSIAQALLRLDSVAPSPQANRVRLRLQLLRTEIASLSADSAGAGATIDKLLSGLPVDSIERACALSERAIAYDFSNQPDRAVATALLGYRLAAAHGWPTARMENAFTLAVNFRRAGLYDRAEAMIDEVIAIDKQEGLLQNLTEAEIERGKVLVAAGRVTEARAALTLAKDYAAATGDRIAAAAANLPLCVAELTESDLSAAELTCSAGEAELIAGHRADLAALSQAYGARLDLARGRPAAALEKINAVLAKPIHQLLPGQEAQIYRDRSQAFGDLHRYAEAYADLSRADSLDSASNIEQRHRQVAVLSSVIAYEALRSDHRVLQARVGQQQAALERQRRSRIVWVGLALGATLMCVLFASLLMSLRRHHRRLRRYEVILSRAGSQAPHSLLLLDEHRRVCFANRPLFDGGAAPAIGEPVTASIPENLRPSLTAAIEQSIDTRSFVSFDAVLARPDGSQREYELWVLPAMNGDEALGVTLQSIDVTDLRLLERAVVDGASRERRQMGGELHEGLGQELAGVLLMLGNLSTVIRQGGNDTGHLVTEIAGHIAHSIGSVRQLAQDLAPVMIERGSLSGALHTLVGSVARRLNIAISCDCRLEDSALDDLTADHLYQICRQAVFDAALSGACKSLAITVDTADESFVLRIAKDWDTGARGSPEHSAWPIDMMAYRARLLGGVLRWNTNEAGGTSITVTVPMPQMRVAAAV